MSQSFAPEPLTGKIALVTGAAQGIGEATARWFAARGVAGVVLVDRRRDKGEAVAAALAESGTPALFVSADLGDGAAVRQVIPQALQRFGRVDYLCNVAGLTDRGSIFTTDEDLFDRMFAVNVRAPFFLMQDALAAMERQGEGGAVVNVLSVNAHVGAPHLAAYSASKGALLTLTKNTANAVSHLRIRVNGVSPGWVDTPGEHETLRKFHGAGDDWLQVAEAGQPFGRLLKPDDIARVIGFLASPDSMPTTGTIVDFEQRVFGGSDSPAAYPQQD